MRILIPFSLMLAACQGLGPAPPELEHRLVDQETTYVRRQGRVRIESPWFGGEFKAVAVERRGTSPLVRLQLFPDVGGKVLDLVASPDAVAAHWVHSGEVVQDREELIGFLCVSLIENACPLSWGRVRGGRRTDEGYLVDLEPASNNLELSVRVSLDEDGRPLKRHYELGLVGWTEVLTPEHRFASRDFEWKFIEEQEESIPALPESLFEPDFAEAARP